MQSAILSSTTSIPLIPFPDLPKLCVRMDERLYNLVITRLSGDNLEMDSRKTGLVQNAGILAIGNLSSRILTFLLVPIYTRYLPPSAFGEIDILITLLSMLYIVVSLQSIESVFRYIQDSKSRQETSTTMSSALAIAAMGLAVFSVACFVFVRVSGFEYGIVFALHVFTSVLSNMLLQSVRGMNKMKLYAGVGVFSTVVNIVSNILFVVGLEMGAVSLLWAPVVTNSSVIVVLLLFCRMYQYFRIDSIHMPTVSQHLRFSLPLIPNAIFVWLVSSLGRFILLHYYGTSDVGIMAIALKFPMILSTLNSVFFSAWQVSLVSEFSSQDKDRFASDVFNGIACAQLSAMLVILPLSKIVMFTFVGRSYLSAWVYIPAFFAGVIFDSYAMFYNAGFYGAKKTDSIFYGSITACVVYFVVGMVLAKPLYILGVGIAYSAATMARWLVVKYRVIPYMKISMDKRRIQPLWIAASIFVALYYWGGVVTQIAVSMVGATIFLVANRSLLQKSLRALLSLASVERESTTPD